MHFPSQNNFDAFISLLVASKSYALGNIILNDFPLRFALRVGYGHGLNFSGENRYVKVALNKPSFEFVMQTLFPRQSDRC